MRVVLCHVHSPSHICTLNIDKVLMFLFFANKLLTPLSLSISLLLGTLAISWISYFDFSAFNQDINDWNTSSLLDSALMFADATSFNQHLDRWDMSRVTHMNGMFSFATSFSGNISSWNVSSVMDASLMFLGATAFNQDLCPWQDSFAYNSMVDDIFTSSGCSFQDTPRFDEQGPFCGSECVSFLFHLFSVYISFLL